MLLVVGKSVLEEKHAGAILKELLKTDEPVYLSSLQHLVKNYYALHNTAIKLAEEGYIEIIETEYKGRPAKMIKITEKGRTVAEKLQEADWISKLSPEELEKFKNLRAFLHINIYEDHITVMDIHMGQARIANIYARPKGHDVLFWCDLHDDTDCYHIEYMFADPKLSEFIRSWIEKNGYRLAKKYEKYVEKYW